MVESAVTVESWYDQQQAERRAGEPSAPPAALAPPPPEPAAIESFFTAWPEHVLSGKRDVSMVVDAFVETVTSVPLKASSEPGDAGWRAWYDGGFAVHKFLASKLSRDTFVVELSLLLRLVVACQAQYPDLYAVLKFVPKKNGLNPSLARLQVRAPALPWPSLALSTQPAPAALPDGRPP